MAEGDGLAAAAERERLILSSGVLDLRPRLIENAKRRALAAKDRK